MRIIGGVWRGRRIGEPVGGDVTRPTQDRVREACASMIDAALDRGIEGSSVFDAFGGTGAMGLEMLSRGAAHATFLDSDRRAVALIRRNLESVGADSASWNVLVGDARALAARDAIPGVPFDLVLADPPYARGADLTAHLLRDLGAWGLLSERAVISFEHAAAAGFQSPAGFEKLRQKRYGAVAVDLLRWGGAL